MIYDSKEELYFSWYLDELCKAGYVSEYSFQPGSFVLSAPVVYKYEKQLKTKTKIMTKRLIREHSYTTDFRIIWDKKANGVFYASSYGQLYLINTPFITTSANVGFVEIKPVFDQNNMTRLFTINQKWVYQKYGTYIQKIIPVKLFESTFTPQKYLLTDKTNKPRKLKYQPKTLNDFISQK